MTKRRTRVTMYSYLDRSTFINDTCDENGQPFFIDRLPYLPAGAKVLSIATMPPDESARKSYPDSFTLLITWKEPKPYARRNARL